MNLITDITDIYCKCAIWTHRRPKKRQGLPAQKEKHQKKTDKITQNYIKRRFELDFRG